MKIARLLEDLLSVPLALLAVGCMSPRRGTTAIAATSMSEPSALSASNAAQSRARRAPGFLRSGLRGAGHQLRWAPGGRHYAYVTDGGRRYRIVVGDASRRSRAVISDQPTRPRHLLWLDQDQFCFVESPPLGKPSLIIYSLAGGRTRRLPHGRAFTPSPDGKRLAFVAAGRRHEVWVGKRRVWPREAFTAIQVVSGLFWAPDSNGVAFIETENSVARLVVILVLDDPSGDLVWTLPEDVPYTGNRLFWSEGRILVGKKTLNPIFSASWTRSR